MIVACGLLKEARLIARAGGDVRIVAGGGDAAALERKLDAMAGGAPGIVLSCGIAGGLDPSLRPGDIVIDGDRPWVARLAQTLPEARIGVIVGADQIVATAAAKRALAASTGGIAADMESHIARRMALRRGLPFAAIRVISDTARDDLPPAALVGMKPDGGMALGAVLRSLAANPAQLPRLLRTGRQASAAFRGLGEAMAKVVAAGFDRLDPATLPPG